MEEVAKNREEGGALVRDAWRRRYGERLDANPAHLVPWEQLGEWDKETDRFIWEQITDPYILTIQEIMGHVQEATHHNKELLAHYERVLTDHGALLILQQQALLHSGQILAMVKGQWEEPEQKTWPINDEFDDPEQMFDIMRDAVKLAMALVQTMPVLPPFVEELVEGILFCYGDWMKLPLPDKMVWKLYLRNYEDPDEARAQLAADGRTLVLPEEDTK